MTATLVGSQAAAPQTDAARHIIAYPRRWLALPVLSLSLLMIVFGAGSFGAALAGTTTQLVAMRIVMGVGAAFVMPATMAVLTSMFTDPTERAKAIGVWSAVAGL